MHDSLTKHAAQLTRKAMASVPPLAAARAIQGLVAQGRTIQETLEIARDVAKKLLEARSVADEATAGRLPEACDRFDYPLVVAT